MSTGFATEAEHVVDLGGLSASDIARATSADPTTVRAWIRGNRSPSGRNAERLVELSSVVERLSTVMAKDYIRVWLLKPSAVLEEDKPLDVVAEGRYRDVLRLVAALESTAMS
ncbi:helix-turn-helix transcriptional regulator [Paraconexibacter antarcticus]|uniref:Helix-turn-helix transcriptional regulator n=1 Tax=Paraconexibacter antarcticus TaxID=2949664 RepID=A0ABY5DPU3_9ACTN|nr:helix-turn-helix transcriptional regulator [Paraconexibacter antarcticus]UTI63238.1 helix-turn-helix transcriptional regulator [Paraconexibacter antarcticus]